MSNQDHAITCFIELSGGRRVEVGITVTEEPLFPTPNEPDIQRAPALHEWADICAALGSLRFTCTTPEKPKPASA